MATAPTIYKTLTTTFIAPTKCWNDPPGGWAIFTDVVWFKEGGDDKSTCFPPNYPTGDHKATDTSVVYSPGICPSGWTSACVRDRTMGGGEVVTTCCPDNYICVASVPAHEFESVFGCVTPLATVNRAAYTIDETANVVSSMYQRHIMVMTQATSTSSSLSSSQTSTPTPSLPSSTALSTSSASTAPSSAPASGGGEMSTAVKAGIAIGAVAAAFVIALLIYIAWRLSPKKRAPGPGPEVTEYKPQTYTGQVGQWGQNQQPQMWQGPGERAELDEHVRPVGQGQGYN